jgi:hypothetical protein
MVIPPELEALRGQLDQLWGWAKSGKTKGPDGGEYYLMDVENVDQFTRHVLALLPTEADTKALVETATRLGRELGRREAADEIAAKCHRRAQLAERVPEGEQSGAREAMVLTWLEAERLAHEIATKDSTYEPESNQTRCRHCGFYRPSGSGLEHHPKCPHASSKP